MYNFFLKRVLDFIIALIILVFILPLLLISAALIKITSKGPLFFFQSRVGLNGEIFKIFKFRTMTDEVRIASKEILKGNSEVTKVGYYLRRFKIDELPQLFNVLKGDMSLIGPRPCLPEHVRELNDDGMFRLNVRPGMTGLAQVNGNIYLTWEERWKYDRLYVENLSFLGDLKIIILTIAIVLYGEDKFVKKP